MIRICRYGLAALFLFTAIAKLAIVKEFVKNMGELLASSGFDYQRWSWPATIVVIVAEIVTVLEAPGKDTMKFPDNVF